MQGDITSGEDILKLQLSMNMKPADVVLSDIAPELSGEKFYDTFQVMKLNTYVLAAAFRLLRPGGTLLIKTFQSGDEVGTYKFCQLFFKEVHRVKPHASRKRSPELYFLGMGYLIKAKGYKLTDYFNKLNKLSKEPDFTYDQFFDIFPGEYTKSRDEFRKRLIEQSKFLEATGIESR